MENKGDNKSLDLRARIIQKKIKDKSAFFTSMSKKQLVEYCISRSMNIEEKQELNYLRRRVKELEAKYEPKKGTSINYEGFRSGWPTATKILFILQRNNRPMTTKEILQELLNIEPILIQQWRNPINNISKLLGNAAKANHILRINLPGSNEFYYRINLSSETNHLFK